MVALLVRLKLTLLRNNLRRSLWRTVGLVLGMVYALGLVVLAVAGLVALRYTSVNLIADVTVLAFGLLTAGWLVMSLLVFGVDETVDPARFALLPVRARELLPGLLVAGLIGSPGIATVVVSLALLVAWSGGAASLVAAVVAVPIGVATCFLLSRFATSAAARFLGSRRFRDLAALVLVLFGLVLGIGGNLFGNLYAEGTPQMRFLLAEAARAMAWTPFGWAWAVPADVARGAWGPALVRLLLAVALMFGLWFGWAHFLALRLTEPLDSGGGQQKVRSGSLVDKLYPATPAGGVAGRTLRYWRRDPRYLAGVAGFLIAPVSIIVSQLASPKGSPELVAFTPVLLGLLMGMTIAQDLSYDGTAIWLHISTGIRGADDRAGRVMSTVTVLGPVLVVTIIVTTFLGRQWQLVVPVLGLTLGLTLIGLGVGCWVGALWQYPAPPPGANPFQKGSAGSLPALLSFSVSTLVTLLLVLPTLALVIGSIWVHWLGYLAAVVGVLSGVLVLKVGIAQGGKLLDRRWPEVMFAVSENR
ncbi:hypothetical protein GCM10009841_10430 [Microlunatus panaciterrae]|uniref:ABC-2 type transport system permease protein n=1 Tax=Microlunatus panaciterrae TaxID=400768 RepID=A0ABS2RLZ0_9ACTN|nr:hypothetical protein [Microlunatus panaciterrae]MBM7799602.1 ABC-2 type transport system permease protein [Microlunatus panaciterrae]